MYNSSAFIYMHMYQSKFPCNLRLTRILDYLVIFFQDICKAFNESKNWWPFPFIIQMPIVIQDLNSQCLLGEKDDLHFECFEKEKNFLCWCVGGNQNRSRYLPIACSTLSYRNWLNWWKWFNKMWTFIFIKTTLC